MYITIAAQRPSEGNTAHTNLGSSSQGEASLPLPCQLFRFFFFFNLFFCCVVCVCVVCEYVHISNYSVRRREREGRNGRRSLVGRCCGWVILPKMYCQKCSPRCPRCSPHDSVWWLSGRAEDPSLAALKDCTSEGAGTRKLTLIRSRTWKGWGWGLLA